MSGTCGAADRRATAALLWQASAPWPDLDALKSAIADGADYDLLADAAMLGRVGPLVLRSLRVAGSDPRASAWSRRLHAEAGLRKSQELLLLPRALATSVGVLARAGLEPLVLKGPSLVGRYPAPGLRGMDDLDLLVAHSDRPRAEQALLGAGWRPAHHVNKARYDTPFTHPDLPGLPVELHVDLHGRSERTSRLRPSDLLEHRRKTSMCGVEAWGLPPELEIVQLATHAAKPWHVFSRLIWVADLAVVAGGQVDWDLVEALATRWRCKVPVAAALTLATRLGASVPPELTRLPERRVASGVLNDVLDPTWALAPDAALRSRVAAALMDRRRDQLRMAARWVGEPAQRGHRVRAVALMVRGAMRWGVRARRGPLRGPTGAAPEGSNGWAG